MSTSLYEGRHYGNHHGKPVSLTVLPGVPHVCKVMDLDASLPCLRELRLQGNNISALDNAQPALQHLQVCPAPSIIPVFRSPVVSSIMVFPDPWPFL